MVNQKVAERDADFLNEAIITFETASQGRGVTVGAHTTAYSLLGILIEKEIAESNEPGRHQIDKHERQFRLEMDSLDMGYQAQKVLARMQAMRSANRQGGLS